MALLTNINGKFSVSDAGAVTFNNAFTFPTADGTANYVLKTNGSGQLAWGPDNDGGDITGSGTANKVTKFTGAKTIGDGPITFSGDNSTFAGNVTLDNILLTTAVLPAINTPSINLRNTNNEVYFQAGSANVFNFMKADYTTMLALDGTNTATFAGEVDAQRFAANAINSEFRHGTAWGTNLKLTNTNADGSPPLLTFLKDTVSPADNDYVGFINYRMDNSNGDEFSWVELSSLAIDVTDGSESSAFRIGTWGAGTEYTNTIMAKSGKVGIGTDSPAMGLHVEDTKGALFGNSGASGSSYFSPSDENTLNGGYGLNTDTADIWLNYRGYQDGFTKFRDTRIGNGKGSTIVMVDGSEGRVGIGTTGPITTLDIGGTPAVGVNIAITAGTSDIGFRATSGTLDITSANAGVWRQLRAGSFIGNVVEDSSFAGNVGIGTISPDLGAVTGTRVLTIASPTAERWGILELAGNRTWGGNQVGEIKFISTDSTNNGVLVSLTAINDPTSTGTGGSLTFKTRPNSGSLTERMRIDSSGDVTIQTSGADDIKNLTINSSNGSSQVAGFIIQNDGANGYIHFKAGAGNATPTTKLTIGNAANSGNVGINKTSPQYQLDIGGQIRAEGIVNIGGLGVAASGALANVDINDTDVNGTSTTYQSNITFKAAGTVKAQIGKLSNSTSYFTAAKNFDGPVNIIANDIHPGHTHTAEYIFGYEPANNQTTWGLNLVDNSTTSNSLYISAEGLSNNSSIFFGGYINALLVTRISLNQTLGTWLYDCPDAGTSNVSVKWRKYNTGGYMQNMIDFEDDGDIKNINGSYGTISSDERVKENIVDATSKLNDILSLKVKNFNFIGDNKKQIGLIAQEVEEIFPSWVNTRDTRIYKTHDEDGNPLQEQGELVSGHEDGKSLKVGMEFAILTKAIQEQQEIIESLKQRIEQLEN